eukprot:c20520_g1_i1.p1 GENE.c20520_g1_i1~~c20520_g1_i1.p1  ORF type:complete len:253 (+),score=69.03 c20520_g1_i1:43-801(+)
MSYRFVALVFVFCVVAATQADNNIHSLVDQLSSDLHSFEEGFIKSSSSSSGSSGSSGSNGKKTRSNSQVVSFRPVPQADAHSDALDSALVIVSGTIRIDANNVGGDNSDFSITLPEAAFVQSGDDDMYSFYSNKKDTKFRISLTKNGDVLDIMVMNRHRGGQGSMTISVPLSEDVKAILANPENSGESATLVSKGAGVKTLYKHNDEDTDYNVVKDLKLTFKSVEPSNPKEAKPRNERHIKWSNDLTHTRVF